MAEVAGRACSTVTRAGSARRPVPGSRGDLGRLAHVMCLVNARGVERVEDDVLVVSIDRLTRVLSVAAGVGQMHND